MRLLLTVALIAGLASCGEPLVHEFPSEPVASDVIARPLGRLDVAGAHVYRGDTYSARTARLELLDSVMDRFVLFRSTVQRVEAGKTDAGVLQEMLSPPGISEAERWFFEQMAATLVLEAMVGVADAPEGLPRVTANWKPGLAERCLRILLEHRSPNAPLLARTLERLSDRWTASDITAAATRASGHATEWLAQECEACGRGLVPARTRDARFSVEVVRVRRGVEELLRIASGSKSRE